MIKLYSYRWVPPVVQGLVRDLRVRWALEEAGIPYEEIPIRWPEDKLSPDYLSLQPFGQVPAIEEEGLKLFESGAIVMHIAERSEALMPRDATGRARTQAWMFAALTSVEPWFQDLALLDLQIGSRDSAKQHRAWLVDLVQSRLKSLSTWLGDRDYLEADFTAGDLLMSTVLRILRHTEMVASFPNVEAYQKRCEARPAFEKAIRAQMATFEKHAPKVG